MSKFKRGDKVKVIQNTCRHRIPIGTVIEIFDFDGWGWYHDYSNNW